MDGITRLECTLQWECERSESAIVQTRSGTNEMQRVPRN